MNDRPTVKLQFSLRSLMIFTTLCAFYAWIVVTLQPHDLLLFMGMVYVGVGAATLIGVYKYLPRR